MPCRGEEAEEEELERELDLATKAACELMKVIRFRHTQLLAPLTGKDAKGNHYKNIPQLSTETRAWFERHDKLDKKREKEQKEEIRRRAMKKLTLTEQRVLGLLNDEDDDED